MLWHAEGCGVRSLNARVALVSIVFSLVVRLRWGLRNASSRAIIIHFIHVNSIRVFRFNAAWARLH